MKRWPPLATNGTDTYSIDWTQKLGSGVTLSSVSYAEDPDSGGITFANLSVANNISSVDVTANDVEQVYKVKCTPTLSAGAISPVSTEIKIVKHKPAR